MGLDVYLNYWRVDSEMARAAEKEGQKQEEAITKRFLEAYNVTGEDELPREAADGLAAEIAAMQAHLHLNKYGAYEDAYETIEIPSQKYPDHLFKIGYWRSSYNEGGINNVLSRTIGRTLYELAPEADSGEEFFPDWDSMLAAARLLQEGFGAFVARGGYDVLEAQSVFQGDKSAPTSGKEALERFLLELGTHEERGLGLGDYSNKHGEFLFDHPLRVSGIVYGRIRVWFSDKMQPTAFLIYEQDFSFYTQALEIVIETIEWVNKQPDRHMYGMYWSG